jgi:hypothetical protein
MWKATSMPWTTKIARPLVLDDGTYLVTFKDAIEALINGIARTTVPAAIEHAIKLLVKAEKSRSAADIEAATDQIELVLGSREVQHTARGLTPAKMSDQWPRLPCANGR